MLWELLAADVEGVEGIGAIGTVFEEVFLRFGLLLHTFIFAEAISPTLHPGRLDGEDEVVVVLSVEVRHEALLPGEALVDEEILLVMPHRVAKVHVDDLPAVAFKLMDNHPVENWCKSNANHQTCLNDLLRRSPIWMKSSPGRSRHSWSRARWRRSRRRPCGSGAERSKSRSRR